MGALLQGVLRHLRHRETIIPKTNEGIVVSVRRNPGDTVLVMQNPFAQEASMVKTGEGKNARAFLSRAFKQTQAYNEVEASRRDENPGGEQRTLRHRAIGAVIAHSGWSEKFLFHAAVMTSSFHQPLAGAVEYNQVHLKCNINFAKPGPIPGNSLMTRRLCEVRRICFAGLRPQKSSMSYSIKTFRSLPLATACVRLCTLSLA